jgi:hypothetical protein
LRHAPLPSQKPSRPQVEDAAMVHWFSGSVPAAAAAQVPSDAVIAHDRQVPVQAVEQQTPCAQKPELHSLPAAQVEPLGLLPQLVPMHVLGDAQSATTPHMVLQTLATVSHA